MPIRHVLPALTALFLALAPARADIRFAGGDGASIETAVVILGAEGSRDGVRAEYVWVAANRPGWEVEMQALVGEGDRMFDVLMLRKGDQTQSVYFDISDFFGK